MVEETGNNDDNNNDDGGCEEGSGGGSNRSDESEDDGVKYGGPTMAEVLAEEGGTARSDFIEWLLSGYKCWMCRSVGPDHYECRACGEDSNGRYVDKVTMKDVEFYLGVSEKLFEAMMDGF